MKATCRVELHGGFADGKFAQHDGSGAILIQVYQYDRAGRMRVGMAVYEVNENGTAAFWLHNTWEPTKQHE